MKASRRFTILSTMLSVISSVYGQETPPPYVVLATGDHVSGEHFIQIPNGYLVEIVSLDLVTGTDQPGTPGDAFTFSRVEIQRNEDPFNFNLCYTSENIPNVFPKFIGPCSIDVMDEGGRNSRAIIGLRITEISDTDVVPTNTVVIPSDGEGEVTIILESSEDLVTWTPALPGTYGSSTEKRFFRVRAVFVSN